MTNEELIAEVRRLDKAATAGPWEWTEKELNERAKATAKKYRRRMRKSDLWVYTLQGDNHIRRGEHWDAFDAPVLHLNWGDLKYSSFVGGPNGENADLIGSYRTLAPALADALEAATTRIQELEAQAAELAETLQRLYSAGAWTGEPSERARGVLANLPQAVQQHMARDRAAEGMAKSFDQLFNHPASTAVGRAAQWHDAVEKQAAYRAAGGEG